MTDNIFSRMKFPEYKYQEYPKWVGNVIVEDAEQEKRLFAAVEQEKQALAASTTPPPPAPLPVNGLLAKGQVRHG